MINASISIKKSGGTITVSLAGEQFTREDLIRIACYLDDVVTATPEYSKVGPLSFTIPEVSNEDGK